MQAAIAAGILLAASTSMPARAAGICSEPDRLAIRVSVQTSPVPVRTDFSAAELQAMAPGNHRHAPLGFYRNAVGYRLAVSVGEPPPGPCRGVMVIAQLVEVDREIQIASDLLNDPCRMRIAVRHYQRHAEAAEVALQTLAHGLPTTLRDTVLQTARTDDDASFQAHLETSLNGVVDTAVAGFSKHSPEIRDAVDSPPELQKLKHGCAAPDAATGLLSPVVADAEMAFAGVSAVGSALLPRRRRPEPGA